MHHGGPEVEPVSGRDDSSTEVTNFPDGGIRVRSTWSIFGLIGRTFYRWAKPGDDGAYVELPPPGQPYTIVILPDGTIEKRPRR